MNKILLVLAVMLLLSGCESSTKYGSCVGITEDQNPGLHYKVSKENLILAIIFSETIVVPIVVLADEFYCPVGKNE